MGEIVLGGRSSEGILEMFGAGFNIFRNSNELIQSSWFLCECNIIETKSFKIGFGFHCN